LDALIFDFDGVVVDSEPVHLAAFQEVLGREGVAMTREDYYGKYLGFDDRDCFAAVAADNNTALSPERITELTAAKTLLVQKMFGESVSPLPGAVELITGAFDRGIPLAICSGALRKEIELAASAVGVLDRFAVIVAAEDVRRGKPDPEGYRMALSQLAQRIGRGLEPANSVVVEDSPAGIAAAKALGMKVLAVATSYPLDELTSADRIAASLAQVTPADLESLV